MASAAYARDVKFIPPSSLDNVKKLRVGKIVLVATNRVFYSNLTFCVYPAALP